MPSNTTLLTILIVVVAIFGGLAYFGNYSGLQIEEPSFSPAIAQKWDKPILTFNIHSYDTEREWNNVNVEIELENNSGNYVEILQTDTNSLVMGKDSVREFKLNPFHVIASEGYSLTYDAKIFLKSDDLIQDSHRMEISIVDDNTQYSKFNLDTKDGDIRFENFNINSLSLKEGNSKTISFQIESYQNNRFDEIKVDHYIPNNSGKFLSVTTPTVKEILSSEGDITGLIEMDVEALDSEGTELKYRLDLALFNKGKLYDTETIDVKIIS